jgi:hypothetical protein
MKSTVRSAAGACDQPLSPTQRTTLRRHDERGSVERDTLYAVLDEALVCHLGVVVEGTPLVVPTAFGYDLQGPDEGGSLYLHGSVASQSLSAGAATEVCVTVTLVDGLVLARSGFHHSMNYRSAVVRGRARRVTDDAERRRALDIIVDHAAPGRAAAMREPSHKELAATAVLAVPLIEASVKRRTGGVEDDRADVVAGGWAGVVTTGVRVVEVQPDPAAEAIAIPQHVQARIALFP